MFCRLGSVEASRPVTAVAWPKSWYARGRWPVLDHLRQLVGVGVLQLGETAMFEDLLRQRVILGQFFQHFLVGRGAARGRLLHHRQALLVEQYLGQLLGRIQVEGLAGECLRLGFECHDLASEFVALLREGRRVDQYAVAFDAEQHLGDRQFQVAVERFPAAVRRRVAGAVPGARAA
jgi:hypothetical protein